MRQFIWPILVGLALVGTASCKNGDSDGSDSDGDPDQGTDTEPQGDGKSPLLLDATVTCYDSGDSAGLVWLWDAEYEDPQGRDNIRRFPQSISVFASNGSPILEDQEWLSCGGGNCNGSQLEANAGGIACVNQADYTFKTALVDKDGNVGPLTAYMWVEP